MNIFKTLSVLLIFIFFSCASVKVSSDYDKNADFSNFKTYAFYKKGIDKVEISDLDKRRILRAIEAELDAKGFVKSEDPDFLISIFTKSREKIDVYNNNYYGWYPWYYGFGFGGFGMGMGMGMGNGFGHNNVITSTEGTLFIDLIDARKKELAWQGVGTGILSSSSDIQKKEENIKEFVSKIMMQYPPQLNTSTN
ncbi:MAG: DUF4136 domain-containing protein [Flavobacteriaceae bacterium]|nr:DUF4136 domain-containing protein [Flavobacteriaceae bacterium]